MWIVKPQRIANGATGFDIYADDKPNDSENSDADNPAEKLAQMRKRLESIVLRLKDEIANHRLDKARFYSDEERKDRANMRLLREKFNLEEPPPPLPLLRVEIVRDDRFSEIQRRCDNYMAQGVPRVWILNPDVKRAYTVAKSEGLREFKGEILRLADPPLEMDLKKIFDYDSFEGPRPRHDDRVPERRSRRRSSPSLRRIEFLDPDSGTTSTRA
jgi:hypothetical protein